jgi:acyl-CoA synthetase (AMP-forming)/AMP-acid ligase II
VSPREIEDTLLANPDKLVIDAAVAGVSGGRTSDEKNPRAWVVLSSSAKHKDPKAVIQALNDWTQKSLSKYKWLRGGIEIVDEVCYSFFIWEIFQMMQRCFVPQIPKNPTGKVLRRVLQDRYEQSIEKARSRL